MQTFNDKGTIMWIVWPSDGINSIFYTKLISLNLHASTRVYLKCMNKKKNNWTMLNTILWICKYLRNNGTCEHMHMNHMHNSRYILEGRRKGCEIGEKNI
jgi:hypothetical protein